MAECRVTQHLWHPLSPPLSPLNSPVLVAILFVPIRSVRSMYVEPHLDHLVELVHQFLLPNPIVQARLSVSAAAASGPYSALRCAFSFVAFPFFLFLDAAFLLASVSALGLRAICLWDNCL